eukprot:5543205-Lingulodinium_polyedra.AAC.1
MAWPPIPTRAGQRHRRERQVRQIGRPTPPNRPPPTGQRPILERSGSKAREALAAGGADQSRPAGP